MKMIELKDSGIHIDGQLRITIWSGYKSDDAEERNEGESWLAMRERTKPLREQAEKEQAELTEKIYNFLKS